MTEINATNVAEGDLLYVDKGRVSYRLVRVVSLSRNEYPDYQFGHLTTATIGFHDGTYKQVGFNNFTQSGDTLERANLDLVQGKEGPHVMLKTEYPRPALWKD